MKLQIIVHDYAGSGRDHICEIVKSSAQFARDLINAGYSSDAWYIADEIDTGKSVWIGQFDITVQKI